MGSSHSIPVRYSAAVAVGTEQIVKQIVHAARESRPKFGRQLDRILDFFMCRRLRVVGCLNAFSSEKITRSMKVEKEYGSGCASCQEA